MKKFTWVLFVIYAVLAALTIVFFNGTGDAGDSIYHYLFAKYAWLHPELFFDQWAKPVYVLLACPFAQFGFTGVKIFNAIVSLVTILLTFKTAENLKIKNPVVCFIIMVFSPLYYILTFSGLTEPLFAFGIAMCLYLSIKNKQVAAALVLSFLPFVRSEGLIFLGVFGLYFLIKRKWKLLPLLFSGSLVYSIAGYFVYHDLLWVFSKIPYAHLSSQYGSGKPFHFAVQMLYVTGVPVYILFWIGIISMILRTILRKIVREEKILVFIGFLCFFIAHSVFWYFGIFNSMGLKRVLICVMPMIAIISLQGFNFITEVILHQPHPPTPSPPGEGVKNPFRSSYLLIGNKHLKLVVQIVLVGYIMIFPFTSNPAAVNWKRDMMLNLDQQSALAAVHFTESKKEPGSHVLCAHPYVCMMLNMDCFDNHKRLGFSQNDIDRMKEGDLILWENWFALVESNIKKEDLDQNAGLVNLYNSKTTDDGREILYSVYGKKKTSASQY